MPEERPSATNLEWIVLYCGLSLGTRLNIVAIQPQIQHAMKQLRRLDIKHVFPQVILRIEASSDAAIEEGDDGDILHQLARRVELLQTCTLTVYKNSEKQTRILQDIPSIQSI